MILIYDNFFNCHVGHIKQTKQEMKNTNLGDIKFVDGKYYEVVKWYYYYITLKPISKLKIILNELLKQ